MICNIEQMIEIHRFGKPSHEAHTKTHGTVSKKTCGGGKGWVSFVKKKVKKKCCTREEMLHSKAMLYKQEMLQQTR